MAAGPHIAYLFSRYPVVSQTFCDSEMLSLEASGVRLSVASLNPPPTSFRHQRLQQLKAEIHYPPPAPVLKGVEIPPDLQSLADEHAKKYPQFKMRRARNAAYFARLFARIGIDHVHVHFANQATWTALFLKKAGFPFSFTAHAQDFMVDLGSNELLREMAAEAEFVIAVSEYSRNLLRELCPASADKIHRVYNGIEVGEFASAREEVHQPSDPRAPLKIISIGRLIEFKGFHHLIEAVDLLGKRGVLSELQIIGEGPWRERLENQIASQGLSSRVRLRGILDNEQVRTELASSDVFALACCVDDKGATDVLPTVITEAMAAGLPVVSTRLAAVPEMVEHEKTGLLVEPGNPQQLAEALARLVTNRELRMQLGAAARRKVESNFDLETTARQVKALFEHHISPTRSTTAREEVETIVLDDGLGILALPVFERGNSNGAVFRMLVAPRIETLRWLRLPQSGYSGVEFLPHPLVIESVWNSAVGWRPQIEALARQVGDGYGDTFLRDARRAVYVAELVRKRGIKHVHAHGHSTVVWAWLVKKLTGCTASFDVEEHITMSEPTPAVIERLGDDFDFGNVASGALRAQLGSRFGDDLRRESARRPLFERVCMGTAFWLLKGYPRVFRNTPPPPQDLDSWLRRHLSLLREKSASPPKPTAP